MTKWEDEVQKDKINIGGKILGKNVKNKDGVSENVILVILTFFFCTMV